MPQRRAIVRAQEREQHPHVVPLHGAEHNAPLSEPIPLTNSDRSVYGGASGTITIDPDAATIARFTTVQLAAKGAALPNGIGAWDDTQVPFCINAFCANALLDTGQPAIVVTTASDDDFTKLGIAAGSPTVPMGTHVQITIAATQSWSFDVGTPPRLGIDVIRIDDGSAISQNLGLAPFYKLDAFYDFHAGQIGIAPKL